MSPADRIFHFLMQRCPLDKASPHMRAWFDWYWRDGRVFAVQERGEIVAAALVRRVADAAQGDTEQNAHSDAAPLLWIEWAANTRGARAWCILAHHVGQRWPAWPSHFAYNRAGRTGRAPRILNTAAFFERLSHG